MAQQKNEYEEMKKSLEEEASKLRQVSDDDDGDRGGRMPLELVRLFYKGEACRKPLWLSAAPWWCQPITAVHYVLRGHLGVQL